MIFKANRLFWSSLSVTDDLPVSEKNKVYRNRSKDNARSTSFNSELIKSYILNDGNFLKSI